jgi:hypothetical protein
MPARQPNHRLSLLARLDSLLLHLNLHNVMS